MASFYIDPWGASGQFNSFSPGDTPSLPGFRSDPFGPKASLLAGDTTYNMMGGNLIDTSGAPSAMSSTSMMSYAGLATSAIGAIGSFFAGQNQASAQKSALQFQAEMSAINARMAERSAQSLLAQGQQQVGRLTLQAGKIKSAQKASMAANGIDLGEGNAAEVTATTDLMKEIDANTINSNAVRAAWAARTQSVNLSNQSLLQGTAANGINPMAIGLNSLIGSGTAVAKEWYRDKKMDALASAMGF